jgi:hypothetical protein
LTSLSRRKAKELGYPHELRTTRLLARHAREPVPPKGIRTWRTWRRARCAKILDSEEVKPHKVRYYLWPSGQASIFLSSVKSAKEPKTTASVTKRGSMRSYQQHDRRSAN